MPPPNYLYYRDKRAATFGRTARTAYLINNLVAGNVPPDPLPEGERALLPSRAPGPRRTAASAYWIDTSFVLNILTGRVEPPESTYRQMIPDRAPGPRRAANSAYWLDNFLAGNVPGETLPEGKFSIPDFARGPRRARNTTYWIDNLLEGNVPPEPAPPAVGVRTGVALGLIVRNRVG